MDDGDDVTQTNDDDDNDEGDVDCDWLSVLLWNCDEPFDCVPVGTLLMRVKNFAIGLCLDLLMDEATELPPADIVIGIFNSWAGLFNFIIDIFNFCTGKLISKAVLFGGARIYERVISACFKIQRKKKKKREERKKKTGKYTMQLNSVWFFHWWIWVNSKQYLVCKVTPDNLFLFHFQMEQVKNFGEWKKK